jgi:hypothetical protein
MLLPLCGPEGSVGIRHQCQCWYKANYRRALGDAHWPWTTPLADIVSYFPAPLAFLRTCKAEVIAGLSSTQVHELRQRDPAWLTNGEWGVIQFVPGHA